MKTADRCYLFPLFTSCLTFQRPGLKRTCLRGSAARASANIKGLSKALRMVSLCCGKKRSRSRVWHCFLVLLMSLLKMVNCELKQVLHSTCSVKWLWPIRSPPWFWSVWRFQVVSRTYTRATHLLLTKKGCTSFTSIVRSCSHGAIRHRWLST